MQKSALTNPALSSSLVSVEVETKNGNVYRFPAMDGDALKSVLPKGKRIEPSASQPTLAMVNASFAVLSIPFRIIKAVRVNGDEWWVCPA